MSLDAVAIDTETTGLDARTARIIEIAILQLRGLEICTDGAFLQFIHPKCPIPISATEIHGLTETDLRGAAEFRHLVEALEQRIGGAVVIGHNIGYDIAIIDREYTRAGLSWKIPRFLDVRALARVADPHLASYGLRALSDWLDVELIRRHRAFPDAMAAAQVFIALVPRLRACGIRTLAEAELACRDLQGEERLYQVGGWISPSQVPTADTAPTIAAVDSYPYRHRVRDVAARSPAIMEPSTTWEEAARRISDGSAPGGILIVKSIGTPLSFVTAADLLQTSISSQGAPSTLRTVGHHTLPCIAEDDFIYRALGRMHRLGVSHLAVSDRSGEIVGTISAEDLLCHRVTSALILGDEIDAASTVPQLGSAWSKLTQVVADALSEDIQPSNIAGIISAEIRNLTARAARLAEERMLINGKGPPPCAYAVLVLGSAGRGDSLLGSDQDNVIVYETGEPEGAEDAWFAEAGTHIADILHDVGVPYCPGGVMAKNPGCRHSSAIWRSVVESWFKRTGPSEALASDIFFDAVPVHGELMLANSLLDFSFERATSSSTFVSALARFASDWQPPIGMFGRLIVESDGRLDLKRNGIFPIVTAARTLALRHGIRPTPTIERLTELKSRSLADANVVDAAIAAFSMFLRTVLAQQIRDSRCGIKLSTRVQIASLGQTKKKGLIDSMQAVNNLIGATLSQ